MAGLQDLVRRFDAGGPTVTSQADFQSQWDALKGQTDPAAVAQRQALNAALNTYQTNQNLGNLYGVTSAPAQAQFLNDFNKASATPGFQYVSSTPGAITDSQRFEQALAAANAAAPNTGAGNALMNQFTTGEGAADNPFLGQYNYMTQTGHPTTITAFTAQQLYDKLHPTVSVPVYRPASESTNAIGDVFTTKFGGIVDQYKDANGYVHITSGGNQYLINPNSNRIISVTPITHDDKLSPYGQGPNPYQGPNLAKGGAVQMPKEYSQGNWKLI
jgi:hypothetical protein